MASVAFAEVAEAAETVLHVLVKPVELEVEPFVAEGAAAEVGNPLLAHAELCKAELADARLSDGIDIGAFQPALLGELAPIFFGDIVEPSEALVHGLRVEVHLQAAVLQAHAAPVDAAVRVADRVHARAQHHAAHAQAARGKVGALEAAFAGELVDLVGVEARPAQGIHAHEILINGAVVHRDGAPGQRECRRLDNGLATSLLSALLARTGPGHQVHGFGGAAFTGVDAALDLQAPGLEVVGEPVDVGHGHAAISGPLGDAHPQGKRGARHQAERSGGGRVIAREASGLGLSGVVAVADAQAVTLLHRHQQHDDARRIVHGVVAVAVEDATAEVKALAERHDVPAPKRNTGGTRANRDQFESGEATHGLGDHGFRRAVGAHIRCRDRQGVFGSLGIFGRSFLSYRETRDSGRHGKRHDRLGTHANFLTLHYGPSWRQTEGKSRPFGDLFPPIITCLTPEMVPGFMNYR